MDARIKVSPNCLICSIPRDKTLWNYNYDAKQIEAWWLHNKVGRFSKPSSKLRFSSSHIVWIQDLPLEIKEIREHLRCANWIYGELLDMSSVRNIIKFVLT
jgi:hypothetical protein